METKLNLAPSLPLPAFVIPCKWRFYKICDLEVSKINTNFFSINVFEGFADIPDIPDFNCHRMESLQPP